MSVLQRDVTWSKMPRDGQSALQTFPGKSVFRRFILDPLRLHRQAYIGVRTYFL